MATSPRKWTTQRLAVDPRTLGLLAELLDVFDLRDRASAIAQAPSFEEAERILEDARQEARRTFRDLAKLTHPDRGGDPASFRAVKEMHDLLQRFALTPLPLRAPCAHCQGTGYIEQVRAAPWERTKGAAG